MIARRNNRSPSQIHYAERPVADYVRAAVEAAVAIHEEDLPGDILIFLTGALTVAA
jgi:ATP-dependent RNA helicase DDX35